MGGGYLALERGGIDAAAEIIARMNGWQVQSFPNCAAQESRLTGTASNGVILAKFREGERFHSLGYRTVFYLLRSVLKMKSQPLVVGSLIALAGFMTARLMRQPIALPNEVVKYLRSEQKAKLRQYMSKALPSGFASGTER